MSNKLYRVRYKTDTVDIEIESTDKSYVDSKLEELLRTAPQTTIRKKRKPAGPGKRGKTPQEQVEKAVVQQSEKNQPPELNGFTCKVISELADISISHAFRILDGQSMPGRVALAKIAKVVGMSMDDLHKELLKRKCAATEREAASG